MIEQYLDIYSLPIQDDIALCVTTNGVIYNGKCVMGGGTALIVRNKYPGSDKILGRLITMNGNIVQQIWDKPIILAFPTKNHFKDFSDINLIIRSAEQLVKWANNHPEVKTIYLPRPGAALGGLNYEGKVKPAIEHILKENKFVIVDKK